MSDTLAEAQEIVITFTDDSLSKEQKEIIKLIYSKAKESVQTLINNMNMDNALKITYTLAQIIKMLEKVNLNGNKVSGASKKQIAFELFKLLLNDLIQDENIKLTILALFNTVGEEILETLVDVSKNVNTTINQVIDEANGAAPIVQNAPCCLNLFHLFMAKKVVA